MGRRTGLSGGAGLSELDSWPAEHRAAGWLARDGRMEVAGEADRPFALASVTKLLSSMALLVAIEEETVALDEPIGPPGATVRLLLAHAAGLPFDGADPIAEPGQRRTYSNTGFEVLGRLVSERASMPFGDYLREAVLVPLAMASTTLDGSPAHGATSTVSDLLRFAAELLEPGRVVAAATLTEATTAQLPQLDGVLPGFGSQSPNPWGLGFEIRDAKAPHWTPPEASPDTFGHFGQSGAFLWVDPDAGVACTALTDRAFGDWARQAWPALGTAVLTAAGRAGG